MVDDTTTSGGSGSSSSSDPTGQANVEPVFNHEQCLFCNKLLGSFDSSAAHMQTAHGLFVPDKKHLAVDLETLFTYLHLVIVGYHECIYCGTQRSTLQAVQQHMLGKGHCKFDVDRDGSEYADFYDSGPEAESDEDDNSVSGKARSESLPVQPDEHSLRLPSGRIIFDRSQPQTSSRRQPLKPSPPGESADLSASGSTGIQDMQEPAPSTSLVTRQNRFGTREERKMSTLSKQRETLSANDERSLAHLSWPERRAVLAIQQKQADKARRIERRYRSRVEGLGNQTLMEHFVKDAADKRTLWK